ncbi:MAG: phage tail sheath subtilisin-like domain-containing protein [Nitrospira sp.]|nr:phage tail sheath subtilisin-like domain-containing protein [Nitrospira sp.]
MPTSPTYPGVYIEEIPSGVRTITGVATSIAAFVGWAPKGPTDHAELVLSWPDFDRKFGGLNQNSLMSYAVYHFFSNGGQRAYIVRLVTAGSQTSTDNAATAEVILDTKLKVTASNPGDWANDYAIVTKQRSDDNTRFRLVVTNIKADKKGIPVEVFENLSMNPQDARYVVNVLKDESALVTVALEGNASSPPADTPIPQPPDPNAGVVPDNAKLAKGANGKVLKPDEGDFETAMLPVGGTGGVYHLDRIDLFNLLCVPGETTGSQIQNLQEFCRKRRAFLIADCNQDDDFGDLDDGLNSALTGSNAINAAFYFPWILAPDALQENRSRDFPPCGFVAGLYARTDANRGVWKAPAGTEASLTGVVGVKVPLTNDENGVLNPKAINCIRNFPVYGTIVWGARTLQGNDEIGSEWKYIPVRRTALFIEESLYRGTKWVVFEPNDEPLWAQIRLNIGAFMHNLFRQGAFQGSTPRDAYFVKCDKETTTQNDINLGIVNIVVGFAPLKPAEFVIIKLQQMAGQIEV